jgi:hypothetical protein
MRSMTGSRCTFCSHSVCTALCKLQSPFTSHRTSVTSIAPFRRVDGHEWPEQTVLLENIPPRRDLVLFQLLHATRLIGAVIPTKRPLVSPLSHNPFKPLQLLSHSTRNAVSNITNVMLPTIEKNALTCAKYE